MPDGTQSPTRRRKAAYDELQQIATSDERNRFIRNHAKELGVTIPAELDDDEEDILATLADDFNQEDLKNELINRPDWEKILYTKRCFVCNNLDPRAHMVSRVFRSGSKLMSFLELQHLSSGHQSKMQMRKCGFCDVLIQAVEKLIPYSEWRHYGWPPQLGSLTLVEGQPALLTVELWGNSPTPSVGIEIFKSPDVAIDAHSALGSATTISRHANSDKSWEFVKACLSECLEKHAKCKSGPVISPKRLVRFQKRHTTSDIRKLEFSLKLVVLAGPKHVSYAALSHRWGDGNIPRSTNNSNSLETFQTEIEWSSLPKTFQDGIIVAGRLGLEYIWIDSLCIVQDDPLDWREEAAKMGQIYSDAYITIAASSSPSGAVSFLQERPSLFQSVPIKFFGPKKASVLRKAWVKLGIGQVDSLTAVWTLRVAAIGQVAVACWSKTNPYQIEVPGPLSTRGWTLQERMLSTRIVHFSAEGLIWECLEAARSEDSRRFQRSLLTAWEDFEPIVSLPERDAQKMRNKLQIFWRDILSDYTARILTFRKDILPALSSITARMHDLIGSTYLAGLWQDRFIEDLCWRPAVTIGDKIPFLPNENAGDLLPTWSWISVHHPIGFAVIENRGVFVPHCELISCDCVPSQIQSPFGSLSGRTAVLEGCLAGMELWYPSFLQDNATAATLESTDGHSGLNTLVHDGPLVEDNAINAAGEKITTIRRARQGEILKSIRGSVFCLDVGRWVPSSSDYSNEGIDHHFILVLAPSVSEPGAYERLGMTDSAAVSYKVSRKIWKDALAQRIKIV